MFKMRTSILNTTTTEQMGYIVFSFFVYTESTNQNFFVVFCFYIVFVSIESTKLI
ncbi:hypothetical protein [Anaerobutyricum soehngenii]|uniref:hypothetical protein n=1 Tax=Anaerobutyricum soehngenii TaxID=105843 RepID=UPI0032C0303F